MESGICMIPAAPVKMKSADPGRESLMSELIAKYAYALGKGRHETHDHGLADARLGVREGEPFIEQADAVAPPLHVSGVF